MPSSVSAATRRDFLVTSALGGLGLLQPSRSRASALRSANPFTLGVASGDPTPDGVVLWTRLVPDPLNGGGMPELPVLVRWQVAHDRQMLRLARHGVAVAWPSLAHSVHVEVNGLEPDRWYYYRFTVDGVDSPVGRTLFFDGLFRGYARCTVSRSMWRTEFRPGGPPDPDRGRGRVHARLLCHPGWAARGPAGLRH